MHRYSQRKPQNEDKSSQIIEKNKKMADLFSTSQSFIVQDYDIKGNFYLYLKLNIYKSI